MSICLQVTRYITLTIHAVLIIGIFYYDKSTQTLYKYLHERLEIKDIRCIHQGIEREKKRKKDGSHFVSLNVLILDWKKISAYVPFENLPTFNVYYSDYNHTYYMHDIDIII